MLLPYARQMLKMHDDARSRLSSEEIAGRVTLGCPDLYAALLLPGTLARFRESYPGVEVTVRCALSAQLSEEISSGRIDVALATRMPNVHPNVASVTLLRQEPLVWLGAKSGMAFREKTLPLALLPEGNLYRDYALSALNKCRSRLAYCLRARKHRGDGSDAVADAAVIVLAQSVKMPGLQQLSDRDGLPPQPSVDLVLWRRAIGVFAAADHLAAHIARNVGNTTVPTKAFIAAETT